MRGSRDAPANQGEPHGRIASPGVGTLAASEGDESDTVVKHATLCRLESRGRRESPRGEMLQTCVYGYYIRNGKTSHVNAKHGDVTDPTDDMTPRLLITLVFILGIVIAVISTLLLRYIGALSTDPTGEL